MSPDVSLTHPAPHVALVTLNRPQRLNALTAAVLRDLLDVARGLEQDPEVRAWILTGAPRSDGRPAFSAGVDLHEARHDTDGTVLRLGRELTDFVDDMLTPSIAAVDGICTTGGAELAVACDMRIVGSSAQISDWHLKNVGNGMGGWGASTRWPRLVGVAKAKELFLTGRAIDSAEAERIGFANLVCDSADLVDLALTTASAIADMDPAGVRVTLAHLDHTRDMSHAEAMRWTTTLERWLGKPVDMSDRAAVILGGRDSESAPSPAPSTGDKPC